MASIEVRQQEIGISEGPPAELAAASSTDVLRSAEVADIGGPVAATTCGVCRSDIDESGHSQLSALDCENVSCLHVSSRCNNGCGTVNKTCKQPLWQPGRKRWPLVLRGQRAHI